jgi:hypothetical protein
VVHRKTAPEVKLTLDDYLKRSACCTLLAKKIIINLFLIIFLINKKLYLFSVCEGCLFF